EDASRILISCDHKCVERIKYIAVKYALSAENIGSTVPDKLEIRVDGNVSASATVSELKAEWAGALEKALHTETEEQLVTGSMP
ncbi:MAG: phosphoribosylformylglycinamidine synthase II, partial [Candidatus Korobacteraceae bacterium]